MSEESKSEIQVFQPNGYPEIKLSKTRLSSAGFFIQLKDITRMTFKYYPADHRDFYPKLKKAGEEPPTPKSEIIFYYYHYKNRKKFVPFFVLSDESATTNRMLLAWLITTLMTSISLAAAKYMFASAVCFGLFLTFLAVYNWRKKQVEEFYKEYQKYYEELSSKHNLWKLIAYSVVEKKQIKPAQMELLVSKNGVNRIKYSFLSNLEEGQTTSEVLKELYDKIAENIMILKE